MFGLIAGIALPSLAEALKPHIQILVAALLFFAALRIGPGKIDGAMSRMRDAAVPVLLFQVGMPVTATAVFMGLGLSGTPVALSLILMLAAPPVLGSPNLAALSGADPAPAFRLMVIGTAVLPLTVLPVLALMPGLGQASVIVSAAGRLLAVIGLAS